MTHFFNHQTHHRGQAHALITACGEHTGDTDLFLVVPSGTNAAYQDSSAIAGKPDSRSVGMSGMLADRLSPDWASSRKVRAL